MFIPPSSYKFQSEQEYLYILEHYSNHLNQSVARSILGIGKLPNTVLRLEGMSSHGNRLLLNNLCEMNGNYLEIGSWKGSTFISALYNNPKCIGTSIDNHQEFKNSVFKTSAEELKANCETNLVNNESYELITENCFSNDLVLPKKYNVYFYDGFHGFDDQYNALKYYYDSLEPIFYFVCDDYSINRVERGTQGALSDLNIQVITDYKLFGNQLIEPCTKRGFWNGLYVALCVKKEFYPEYFNYKKYAHCFDNN
jgi:hypothetical protein